MRRTQNIHNRHAVTEAQEYIEDHLGDPLSIGTLAGLVRISPFHFQRMFARDTGESVLGYIKTRRLELAANKLFNRLYVSVIEVALECGFETHSSFSRAFKSHFDMTPTDFIKGGADRILVNNFAARPFLKPVNNRSVEMDVDFIELPQMWLQYRRQMGVDNGTCYPDRSRIETELTDLFYLKDPDMIDCCGAYQAGPRGYNDKNATVYYGGIYSKFPANDWSKHCAIIPAGHWAIFTHFGAYEHLHLTWHKACQNWLPANDFEIINGWMLEIYLTAPEDQRRDRPTAQIYVPVAVKEDN